MRAEKRFILHGDIVTIQDIAALRSKSVATVKFWLKSMPAMTDVTDIVEFRCENPKHKTVVPAGTRMWIFHGTSMSAREIADDIYVHVTTVRAWLAHVESGTVVDSIIEEKISNKQMSSKYLFDGKLSYKSEIARRVNCNPIIIDGILKDANVEDGADVTNIIREATKGKSKGKSKKAKFFYYHGKRLNILGISRESGFNRCTVGKLLKDCELESVVDDVIDCNIRRMDIKFIYKGEILSRTAIAIKSGKNQYSVLNKLVGVEPLTDVTDIIDNMHGRSRIFIFHGQQLSSLEIAAESGLSVATVQSILSHVKHGTDVTYLFEGRKCVNKTMVTIDGVEISRHRLSVFLNAENTGSNITSEEYLAEKNYTGRLKLGFDKASRSTWIIDDLWDYECPVCGKHLLLTTDEIITHEHGEICEKAEI